MARRSTFIALTDVKPSEYPANYFDITAVDAHGTSAGFTLRITSVEDGSYKPEMLGFRSGARGRTRRR
jgi:hypothetical protein